MWQEAFMVRPNVRLQRRGVFSRVRCKALLAGVSDIAPRE
jgi:hypothetical protein